MALQTIAKCPSFLQTAWSLRKTANGLDMYTGQGELG
jgi:hypothetical protein